MKITHLSQAIHVDKDNGTSVDYFIFPEYEIHYNELVPGKIQEWHHHPTIWETLFIIKGELEAHWVNEKGEKQQKVVKAGDVIEVENTPHTFANTSEATVKFVVFRFVPTGEDKREIIKNDKVLDKQI